MSRFRGTRQAVVKCVGNPYLLIALAVILFNLIAVYGPIMPLGDDPIAMLNLKLEAPPFRIKQLSALYLLKEEMVFSFAGMSLYLARGLYVLLLMVPISWGFYYILRNLMHLPVSPAVAAAVIPNILPSQWKIPASLNASYTLWGLLLLVMVMIAGHRFLKFEKWRWLVVALAAYFLAFNMMEQTLFLFPALVLFFFWFGLKNGRRIWLLIPLTLFTLFRLVVMVIDPREEPVLQTIETINLRLSKLFVWGTQLSLIVFGLIITFSLYMLLTRQSGPAASGEESRWKSTVLRAWGFAAVWVICSMLPFVWLSPSFSARYVHLAGFGLNLILVSGLWILMMGWRPIKGRAAILLVVLVVATGISRYTHLNTLFERHNRTYRFLSLALRNQNLPTEAQVMVEIPGISIRNRTKSTSYLQEMVNRNDLAGVIGAAPPRPPLYFMKKSQSNNHRKKYSAGETTKPLTSRPLFLFKLNERPRSLRRVHYMAMPMEPESGKWWQIYFVDPQTGTPRLYASGQYHFSFETALEELQTSGINARGILWCKWVSRYLSEGQEVVKRKTDI